LAVTPYLFSGQQGVLTDPNGLLYMRARYYHPGLRCFLNSDPIGFEDDSNWYDYAGGNPLMANDPSGLAVRQVGCTYKRQERGT
jgi:RHS repeat-associated protein